MSMQIKKSCILLNAFIKENNLTVYKFLKEMGASITYSSIKGDKGYFEGFFNYNNNCYNFKIRSNKNEIYDYVII